MSVTINQLNQHLASMSLPLLTAQGFTCLQGEMPLGDVQAIFTAARSSQESWTQLQNIIGQVNAGQSLNQGYAPASEPAAHDAGNDEPQNTDGYASLHVYGGKSALCFNEAETRSGFATINLDGAASVGPRKFDWGNKITIQFTRTELPVICAVLLGMLPKCEFSNHGPNNDKGFSIEHQGSSIFVRMFAKGKPAIAVPVSAEDAFYVSALLLEQLRKGTNTSDVNTLVNLIGATVAPMKRQA